MWPILRHSCPHCNAQTRVAYQPSVFSNPYVCAECQQTSVNAIRIIPSDEDMVIRQQDRELSMLFSTNMTISDMSATSSAQPIPIPNGRTLATNNGQLATPALSSQASSPSSTVSSLVAPPPTHTLAPAQTLAPDVQLQSAQQQQQQQQQQQSSVYKTAPFQQYQYYPSMHYTPSYSFPSTESSELMLRRRQEDEIDRLEALAIERRGFGTTGRACAPSPTVAAVSDGSMDVDMS